MAAILLAMRLGHARLAHHQLAAGFAVLGERSVRPRLLAFVTAVVGLTVLRVWLLAAACGLPHGPMDAALLYLAVSVIGLLPIGPASSPAATIAVSGSAAGVGAAGAAGWPSRRRRFWRCCSMRRWRCWCTWCAVRGGRWRGAPRLAGSATGAGGARRGGAVNPAHRAPPTAHLTLQTAAAFQYVQCRSPVPDLLRPAQRDVHGFLVASSARVTPTTSTRRPHLRVARLSEAAEESNLRAWVLTIARRKAIDSIRAKNRRAVPSDALPEQAAPPAPAPEPEVWDAVGDLPPRMRAAVWLRYAGDLTHGDIARVMDRPRTPPARACPTA